MPPSCPQRSVSPELPPWPFSDSDKNKLYEALLPYAETIARNAYLSSRAAQSLPGLLLTEDWLQEARLLLWEGITTWTPAGGGLLKTHITNRLRYGLLDCLRKVTHYRRVAPKRESTPPSPTFLSLERMNQSSKVLIGGGEESGLTWEELLPDPGPQPEETAIADLTRAEVRLLLKDLPERNRFIMERYLDDGLTYKEIGRSLRPPVGESRVYQIYHKTLSELKAQLAATPASLAAWAAVSETAESSP